MKEALTSVLFSLLIIGIRTQNSTESRRGKQFSLFSIVQFPNLECTGSSSTTTIGTCITSSECSSKGGSADGNCAAGFGVCCVISTSTCGATVSNNATYIRNPGYPSAYTATSAGTCTFKIEKVSSDVCQLRLDFQTFSGFTTATPANTCQDTFAAAGQTGSNPPSICGTNTGYHMYVEFGTGAADSVTLTNTYASGGLSTDKTFNILARQISCTDANKPPTDCVQWFTGTAGTVQSYNFAGGKLLQGMAYENCIRTELGYCAIQWKQSATTSPDPFEINDGTTALTVITAGSGCAQYITIPNLSPDGILPIPVPIGTQAYQSQVCGTDFGIFGMGTISSPLVSRTQPFTLGLYSGTAALSATSTGFNMEYTQLPC